MATATTYNVFLLVGFAVLVAVNLLVWFRGTKKGPLGILPFVGMSLAFIFVAQARLPIMVVISLITIVRIAMDLKAPKTKTT
jgi:hypothetical protein